MDNYHVSGNTCGGTLQRDSTETVNDTGIVVEASAKFSLWLIPSGDTYDLIQNEIDVLAKAFKTSTFEPHVTLIGGVPLKPNDTVYEGTMEKIEKAFRGFGPVPCIINKSKGIVAGIDEETCLCKWNQSTVAILEREDKFLKAVELAHEIFLGAGNNIEKDWFKPPLNEPHLSLAYSNKPLGKFVNMIPEDFNATEIKLVMTDPSSLDGIPSWKEVGKFSLL